MRTRWTPVKLDKDPRARGWTARTGWYLWDTVRLEADTRQRFASKAAAQRECDYRNQFATILLYEDNGGGLHLWFVEEERGWSLQHVPDALFDADASAMAVGEDHDWGFLPLEYQPTSSSLVARWQGKPGSTGQADILTEHFGAAAARYLGWR